MPTIQEIQKTQGTRLSSETPWDSYDSELNGPKMSPELATEVAEYAKKHWSDGKVSAQTQELLAEQKEINEELSKQYQWVRPEEYADFGARIGVVMTHSEFINKLRQVGIHVYYKNHPHPDKLTMLWQPNVNAPLEVACWAQFGQMPELSIMNFDRYGTPLAERMRGWRTCLLQLILKGIISEEKAIKIFGKPRQDQAFDRYNSTLKAFRNIGNSLGE